MNRQSLFPRDLYNLERSRNASLEDKILNFSSKRENSPKYKKNTNVDNRNETKSISNCKSESINNKSVNEITKENLSIEENKIENESSKIERKIEEYLKANTNNFTSEKNEIIKMINNIAEELKETNSYIKNSSRDISDRFNNEFQKVNTSLSDIQEMNRIKTLMYNQPAFNLPPAVDTVCLPENPKKNVEKKKIDKTINCFKKIDDQQRETLVLESGIGSLVGKEIFIKEGKYYVGIGKKKITLDEFKKLIIYLFLI